MVSPNTQIAIIEDDLAMRQAVARLCRALSMPNRSYSSAEEFLASEGLHYATCLIVDVQLPGLSGFQLHDHLRKRGIHLPVVYITGQDQPQVREKAHKAGAAAYLAKPFAAAELIAALRGH